MAPGSDQPTEPMRPRATPDSSTPGPTPRPRASDAEVPLPPPVLEGVERHPSLRDTVVGVRLPPGAYAPPRAGREEPAPSARRATPGLRGALMAALRRLFGRGRD